MKKLLAIILVFSLAFAFAACKKVIDTSKDGEGIPVTDEDGNPVTDIRWEIVTTPEGETVTATTYEPPSNNDGVQLTNKSGAGLTTARFVQVTEEVSYIVTLPPPATDENGKTFAPTQETVVETYPTTPPGNTNASQNVAWPTYDFIKKIPKVKDTVDAIYYSPDKGDGKETVTIRINDMSYADFKAYVEKCMDAGFENYRDRTVPENEPKTDTYFFYSTNNGTWFGATFYPENSPYRYCDVQLTISNYNPAELDGNTQALKDATTTAASTTAAPTAAS